LTVAPLFALLLAWPACATGAPGAPAGASDPVAYKGSLPSRAGEHFEIKLTVGGEARTLAAYVPPGLKRGSPLLLVFDGTDGNAWGGIVAAKAAALADAEKLAVVGLQARAMPSGDWDNHTAGQKFFETHPSTSPETNRDLLAVRAAIVAAQKAWGSDPRRVYALGFSNGAFFAAFAAFAMPTRIAAFAGAGGGLVRCPATRGCTFYSTKAASCAAMAREPGFCRCAGPEKPAPVPKSGRKVPGYLIHARDDTTVSAYYGCSLATRMQQLGHPVSMTLVGGGHLWPADFATKAWSFLSKHAVP